MVRKTAKTPLAEQVHLYCLPLITVTNRSHRDAHREEERDGVEYGVQNEAQSMKGDLGVDSRTREVS